MNDHYKFVFGPLPSSRLGVSLGVNTIPLKTCNLSCVYCQLGRTDRLTDSRKDYFDPLEILEEMSNALASNQQVIDAVTFAGEGEPTLCRSLGKLIRHAKLMTRVPIAVITNGTLFCRPDVRNDVRAADIVIPSLDAADVRTFKALNRPHRRLHHDRMIEGLADFRRSFQGELRIEIMLVAGINDSESALQALREAVRHIRPDMVYLNIPLRPPAEADVVGPRTERLRRAWQLLRDICPVEQGFGSGKRIRADMDVESLRRLARSHPLTSERAIEMGVSEADLDLLADRGALGKMRQGKDVFLTDRSEE
jgi:wyosine [tRNA(Phe)-imidazoG37] synthetase (radical SAM superfamily)